MKQILTNCKPTILGKDTLMTGDFNFLDKEDIRRQCRCKSADICMQICDLLKNNKYQEALDLIPYTRKPYEKETDVELEARAKEIIAKIENQKKLVEELEMDLEMNEYPDQKRSLIRTIDYERKILEAYEREKQNLLSI